MTQLLRLIRFAIVLPLFGVAVALTIMAVSPQLKDITTAGYATGEQVNLEVLDTRSLVYDSDGNLVSALFAENREIIEIEEIPEELIASVLVVEDEDFYEHKGINLRATFRALRENVGAGGISQGGSTITQQLIKNLVLTPEKTLERKVNEAAFAWRLERGLSKEDILEQYLNTVYFGAGAYGVQAAAEVYWGINVQDLGWGEGALLASLIANPTAYDPTLFPEEAERQREIVLGRLSGLGYITEDEARSYAGAPLPRQRNELEVEPENYFVEEVRIRLLNDPRLGATREERENRLLRGGLRIFTTLDPVAQAQAEAARDAVLPADERFTMAMASVEPATGAVLALVGGPGFDKWKFNIATQGARQPGSSFKTFVLVTAFEQGYQAGDRVNGVGPCTFELPGAADYVANNFGRSGGSVDTIRGQTLRSSNCAYLRLGQIVGLDNVIATARAMGISTPLENVLSLPLGAKEVTALDMASAYGVIANGGVRHPAYFVERVEESDGDLVFAQSTVGTQVIAERSACWTTQVLEANVQGGTGTRARLPAQTAAGKTGTAENFEDAWFAGFTPYLATTVWMGNPEIKLPMTGVGGVGGVTGGSFPAQTWGAFNTEYHANLEPVAFPGCEGPTRAPKFLRTENDIDIFNPCPGQITVDTDEDGKPDGCVDDGTSGLVECGFVGTVDQLGNPIPQFCAVRNVQCPAGQLAGDTNGDGFTDSCVAGGDPGCGPNEVPIDTNGNQTFDSCAPISPPGPAPPVTCGPDEIAVDTVGDGAPDTCQPRPPSETPPPAPAPEPTPTPAPAPAPAPTPTPPPAPATLTCDPGFIPVDTVGDGVPDACLPG